MAQIVLAYCSSHAPGMAATPDAAPTRQRENFLGALASIRGRAQEEGLDAVVVISNEHFTNFFLDNYPQVCIGLADQHFAPVETWLGIDQTHVPGASRLAGEIHRRLVTGGFDASSSESLRLDHGVVDVYYELDPSMTLPLVPILQNCSVSPMMGVRRCFDLGRAIGEAIRQWREPLRVAIVGAGGLSHDLGTPNIGSIDREFDHWFLEHLQSGDLDPVLDLAEDELAKAGNGAHEIRSWITAAGSVWPAKVTTLAYEPVQEWLTGMGVVTFETSAATG